MTRRRDRGLPLRSRADVQCRTSPLKKGRSAVTAKRAARQTITLIRARAESETAQVPEEISGPVARFEEKRYAQQPGEDDAAVQCIEPDLDLAAAKI